MAQGAVIAPSPFRLQSGTIVNLRKPASQVAVGPTTPTATNKFQVDASVGSFTVAASFLNGSVGIGTATPAAGVLLDVSAGSAISANFLASSGAAGTNTTSGFAGTQGGAGVPTGVPAVSFTGSVQLYVNTSTATMYGYYSGAWMSLGGGGGSQTLAQTLINGNTTGGTSIVVSSGATITSAASTNLVLTTSSAGQFVEVVEAPGGGSGFYVYTPQGHYALLTTDVENSTSGTQQFVLTQPTWTDSGSNSTTVAQTFLINPTINYTGGTRTGSYQALAISAVETSLPSGTNYLILAQAGTTGTTTEFSVTNGGTAFLNGSLGVNAAAPVYAGGVNVATGTITTSSPALAITQTWNNAATTFTGASITITPTLYHLGSIGLLVNGAPISCPGGASSERFGANSFSTASQCSVFGNGASDGGGNLSAVFGYNASNTGGNVENTIFGASAVVTTGFQSVVIGWNAQAQAGTATVIGGGSLVNGTRGIAIGNQVQCSGNNSICIGIGNTNTSGLSGTISIGIGASVNSPNANGQFVVGGDSGPITGIFLGRGCQSATPDTSVGLHATQGSGANVGGSNIDIGGGAGTGTAGSGLFRVRYAPASGSSSSTLNPYTTASFWDASANAVIGGTGSALATNATNGFAYLAFCAGTPTGVPANLTGSYAGAVPTVVDTTAGAIYGYYSGTWNALGSGGGGSTLGAVVNAGNVVNSVAANGVIKWTTGGSYSSGAAEIQGPSDTTFFIGCQASNSGVGQELYLFSGAAFSGQGGPINIVPGVSAGTDQTGTSLTLSSGISTGVGTAGTIQFNTTPQGFSSGASNLSSQVTATVQGNNQALSGTVAIWTINPTWADGAHTSSTRAQTFLINPTINYTAASKTGAYQALVVNVIETSLPTGQNYLMLLQAGASGGTTEFSVTNAGIAQGFGVFATSGAASTSSTNGYVGTQGGAGVPTGVPATIPTGSVPLYVNTTAGTLYGYYGAAWNSLSGGGSSETLGQAVNNGNVVNSVNANGQITWATGGSYGGATPEILGPGDQAMIISNSAPASGNSQGVYLYGGYAADSGGIGGPVDLEAGNSIGPNQNGAACLLSSGRSTGSGSDNGIQFNVCPSAYSNSSALNTTVQVSLLAGVQNNISGTASLWTINPTWADGGHTSSTVAQTFLINPTIDYTAASKTGHYEALNITVVETSLPSPASGPSGFMLRCFAGSTGTTEVGGMDNGGAIYSGPYSTSMTGVFGQGTMRLESTGYYAITSSNAFNGTIDTVLARRAGGNFGIYQSTTIADTNLGFVSCANLTMINSSGAFQIDISTGTAPAVTLSSTGTFDWTSSNAGGVFDTNLSRHAAGVVQFGTTAANIAGFAAASGFSVGNGTPVTTAGTVAWVSGLGAFTAAAPHVLGPSDQNFFISASAAATGKNLTLSGGIATTPGDAGGAVFVLGGTGNLGGTGGEVVVQAGGGGAPGPGGQLSLSGGTGEGADANGGNCYITPGQSYGAGTSNVQVQTGFTRASGATAQTFGDRFFISGHSVTMSTTSNTATTIVTLNVPTSNSGAGCVVQYCIIATDGTNYDSATGSFSVSSVNAGGTVTASTAGVVDESSECNSGTLTAGATSASVTGTAVSVKIAPAWTTIVPTSVICIVTITCFGNGATITPA